MVMIDLIAVALRALRAGANERAAIPTPASLIGRW